MSENKQERQSDIQFQDAETYNPDFLKDRLTFRDLILQHVKRISTLASVDFLERKKPDPREVYSNAVEVLADLLYPYFDKEMKEEEKKFQQNIGQADTRYKEKIKESTNIGEQNQAHYVHIGDRRRANKKLFRALCSFLHRKRYLEAGSLED